MPVKDPFGVYKKDLLDGGETLYERQDSTLSIELNHLNIKISSSQLAAHN